MNAPLMELLDALPVGCLVLDSARQVQALNTAMEALLGYSRDEVIGLPCRHVLRSRRCVRDCPHATDGMPSPGGRTDCLSRHRRIIPITLTPVRLALHGRPLLLDIVEDLSTIQSLEARISQHGAEEPLIGRCPAMARILDLIPTVAAHDAPVLITGETGTGKGRLAYTIHKASPRCREPFVRFSCGPMAEDLLEAELFGRMSGGQLQPGRFHQAQGGTLYLAEIEALPPTMHLRLLRFLDEGTIQPHGSHQAVRVHLRLMASTLQDPERLVAAEKIRADLIHRLATIHFHLPPLRERGEDFAFLLEHFVGHFARRLKKTITGVAPKAMAILLRHPFAGNVRELKNIVEFAVLVCPEGAIRPEHLPGNLLHTQPRRRGKD